MIRRNPFTTLAVVLLVLLALDLALLVSGYRVLVGEMRSVRVVSSGVPKLFIPGETTPTLRCSYFTGRSVLSFEGDAGDNEECPFVYRPE